MRLEVLQQGLPLRQLGGDVSGVEVESVTVDSRRAGPGVLFVACPGATPTSRHGHEFVDGAIAAGVSALVVEEGRDVDSNARLPIFAASDPRRVAAILSERIWGNPSQQLKVVGITGTNGKTTISFVLAHLLNLLGEDAAVMGTLGVGRPSELTNTGYTTPEAEVLSAQLRALVDQGLTHVVMEVSSHALQTRRVDGVSFAVAAFTNLSQDHLDFHGTMEAYLEAKVRLFSTLLSSERPAVVPMTSPLDMTERGWGRPVSGLYRWGLRGDIHEDVHEDIHAENVKLGPLGVSFNLCFKEGSRFAVRNSMQGEHNLENLLVAAAVAVQLGFAPEKVAVALSGVGGAPGRFERVGTGRPAVVVDYAHSPGALERALTACRRVTVGRVLVVVGAGGDRDQDKRAPMGDIAASLSEGVWLTNDNPRTEPPFKILEQLEVGVRRAGMEPWDGQQGFTIEEDRERAIFAAIAAAAPEDMVLLAGKGHEETMTIGTMKRPFDDREVARRALAAREAVLTP